jgi:hypothetical protein
LSAIETPGLFERRNGSYAVGSRFIGVYDEPRKENAMSKSGQRASRADAGGQRVSDSQGRSQRRGEAQPLATGEPGGKSKVRNEPSPSDVQKKSRPQR